MRFDKHLLINMIKLYAVVALVPTIGLATYVQPKFWIAIYPVVLVVLLGMSWLINTFFEKLGWPKEPVVRQARHRARVVRKKKIK